MKELTLHYGSSLDAAIAKLQEAIQENPKEVFYIDFNGHKLTSDKTTDECYLEVVQCTRAEYKAKQEKQKDKYQKELEEHEAAIPRLTEEWIEKGKQFLQEKYWELWAKIVPIRLNDLYRGSELKATQEIIKILNKSQNLDEVFDEAEIMFEAQGHSGMSASLVLSMVASFHENGEEFKRRIRNL